MHQWQKSCIEMKSEGASVRQLTGMIPITRFLLTDNLENCEESVPSGAGNGENNWGGPHILHYKMYEIHFL